MFSLVRFRRSGGPATAGFLPLALEIPKPIAKFGFGSAPAPFDWHTRPRILVRRHRAIGRHDISHLVE